MLSPLKFTSRGTKISPNSRLLDIGSGSGQFLYEMKTLGLDVYGVEPGNFDKEGKVKYGNFIIPTAQNQIQMEMDNLTNP